MEKQKNVKGDFLTKKEIQSLKERALNNSDFKTILSELENIHGSKISLIDVLKPLKFDSVNDNIFYSVQTAVFKVMDDAFIKYTEATTNDSTDARTKVFGVTIQEQGTELNRIIIHPELDVMVQKNETVPLTKQEMREFWKKSLDKFDDLVPDESYQPGDLFNEASAQGFWDGCVTGGYLWCGKGCYIDGNGCNGPYVYNPNNPDLDNCCRIHDCCYYEGRTHASCDDSLCSCSIRVDPFGVASTMIQLYFC
ncbi:hypothetical protein [Neobacillus sp. OS1-33]|jgi:hypothetical protein|uniref:hypothetical protein n=1 Tax=Neobacillus sp. OS1-33 TaxID=3070683 RepID=UPI0027E15429|nr:hypothetical protein [Neobacillus sp. OS1-33]WML27372.1 hypothetical protein RCG22_07085 [Neobacillus sp. OS1-33]